MHERPLKEGYYSILGTVTIVLAGLRAFREDWAIAAVLAVVAAVLTVDLFLVGRRPHVPSMREAGGWIALYVGLAVAFGLGVFYADYLSYGPLR